VAQQLDDGYIAFATMHLNRPQQPVAESLIKRSGNSWQFSKISHSNRVHLDETLLDGPGEVSPKRQLALVYRGGLASMKVPGTQLRQSHQFSQLLYRTDLKKS